MGFFIDYKSGEYYEGDKADYRDREVKQRPSYLYIEDENKKGEWVLDINKQAIVEAETSRAEDKEFFVANTLSAWKETKASIDAAFPNAKQNEVVTNIAKGVFMALRGAIG